MVKKMKWLHGLQLLEREQWYRQMEEAGFLYKGEDFFRAHFEEIERPDLEEALVEAELSEDSEEIELEIVEDTSLENEVRYRIDPAFVYSRENELVNAGYEFVATTSGGKYDVYRATSKSVELEEDIDQLDGLASKNRFRMIYTAAMAGIPLFLLFFNFFTGLDVNQVILVCLALIGMVATLYLMITSFYGIRTVKNILEERPVDAARARKRNQFYVVISVLVILACLYLIFFTLLT